MAVFPCALSTGETAFVLELWLYRRGTVRVAVGTRGMLASLEENRTWSQEM